MCKTITTLPTQIAEIGYDDAITLISRKLDDCEDTALLADVFSRVFSQHVTSAQPSEDMESVRFAFLSADPANPFETLIPHIVPDEIDAARMIRLKTPPA